MSANYIRDYYGVPAKRGGRIRFEGTRVGTIVSMPNQYLRVRFDDEPKRTAVLHPTWQVEYLDALEPTP